MLGGKPDASGALFYQASVLTNVKKGMTMVEEEIFGPVAALMRFETDDEAIELANDTPFGLAAYLFSSNGERAPGAQPRSSKRAWLASTKVCSRTRWCRSAASRNRVSAAKAPPKVWMNTSRSKFICLGA